MKRVSVFLLIVTVACVGQAQIRLQYNMSEGTTYFSKVEMVQSINQTIQGMAQNIDQTFITEYSNTVQMASGNQFDINAIYTRVKFDQEIQGSPLPATKYDSGDPDVEITPQSAGFAALVNKGFSFSLNNAGVVTQVNGTSKMVEDMVRDMQVDESLKPTMKSILSNQYNDEDMKGTIQNGYIIYPNYSIDNGSTWEADQSLTSPYPMTVNSTFTLNSYDDDYATIEITSKISAENAKMDQGGFAMTINLSGNQTGTMKINRNTGMVVQSSIEQNIKGNFAMQGMSWPVEINSKINVSELDEISQSTGR